MKGMPDKELMAMPPSKGPLVDIMNGRFDLALQELIPWTAHRLDAEPSPALADILYRIKEELLPIVGADEIERTEQVPWYVIEKMAELGLFRLKVPVELGGLGFAQPEYNRVLMHLAKISSALPAYVSAHNSLGCLYPVVHYGTDAQKERFLPIIMNSPTGFCFTEQYVGSDPARMQSYALRVKDDDGNTVGYQITGEKWYTTNPLRAKLLAVVTLTVDTMEQLDKMLCRNGKRCDKHKECDETKPCFSIFLVPTDAEGVTIGPPNYFAGMKGIDNSNPVFRNVYVPIENCIGKEGQGFTMALEALNSGRIAVGALGLQAAKEAYKISSRWAKERSQLFGPIGERELIGEKLVRMATDIYAMQTLVELAGTRTADGKDASVEAALAKAICTERGWQHVDDTMQIRGGRGYECLKSLSRREPDAPDVERMWRGLRVARIFEGSTEVLTLWVCLQGLRRYASAAESVRNGGGFSAILGAGIKFGKMYVSSLFSRPLNIKNISTQGAEYFLYAEGASRKLARTIIEVLIRNQEKMMKKQLLPRRLVNIATEILLIGTVISRSEESGIDAERELALMYAKRARRTIESLFDEISDNDDNDVYPTAKKIMDRKYDSVSIY